MWDFLLIECFLCLLPIGQCQNANEIRSDRIIECETMRMCSAFASVFVSAGSRSRVI